jgi:hypothetical protein
MTQLSIRPNPLPLKLVRLKRSRVRTALRQSRENLSSKTKHARIGVSPPFALWR